METRPMSEIFSENLRNQLYLKRWSQADLAKKMKVTEAAASKWCAGLATPRPKKIDEICILLGCSKDDLLVDHSKPVEYAPEDVMAEELRDNPRLFKLMFYASKLSNEELDKLIEVAKK